MDSFSSAVTSLPFNQILLSVFILAASYIIFEFSTHRDGRALGASKMRDDLESPAGSVPLLGHLLPIQPGVTLIEGEFSRILTRK